MAERIPLFQAPEGYFEGISTSADSITLGGLTMGGAVAMGNNKITGLGDGADPGDVLNKAQIDALVATGNIFKEPVHAEDQLVNGASGGIAAMEVLRFANQPAVGDEVTIDNGVLTRTYSFVANIAGESAATDVSIETDAATAMARLILRANADAGNTAWALTLHTSGETGDEVHVIETKTPVDAISVSRIYGNVWGTPADFKIVPFSDGTDPIPYNEGVEETAANSDPGDGRFGLSRGEATLVDGEVHLALDVNAQFSWESSAQTWNQISGSGAIPDATSGSGGDVKGLATFDSDKGLQIVSGGIAEAKLEANKGLQFESGGGLGIKIDDSPDTLDVDSDGLKVSGLPSQFKIDGTAASSNVSAANLGTLTAGVSSDADSLHTHDGLADSVHSHAHSATTGQGTDDHHPQQHALDGADHTVSGLTSGDVLTALSASTFGFTSPGAASKAPKVSAPYTTATDVTANGDAVYVNGVSTVGLGRADTDTKSRVIGVIQSGGGAVPATVEVVSSGLAVGVLSGATPNTPYYLGATGGISATPPGASNRVIVLGYAYNATDLFVDIRDYGKKPA